MAIEIGSSLRPVEILLVEDNPGDVRLTRESLKDSVFKTNITVAEDGEEALAALRKQSKFAHAPRPDLVLLDLKLPKKDGREVLADMYADPDLKRIPVMILTGTEADESLLQTYKIPSERYCRKPIDLRRFNEMIGQLGKFSKNPIKLGEPVAAGAEGGKKKGWWPFGRR